MEISERMKAFENKTCAVIGFGKSNRPLVDFLLRFGARVTVRDRRRADEMRADAEALHAKGVRTVLGEDYLCDLSEDFLFRTPGLRPDRPELLRAIEGGSVLTSEMELFLELTPARTVGVTGSDGKTTTTTVTGLLLECECKARGGGRVFVGGNIGTPLLPQVEQMTEADVCVIELSSFQLQTAHRSCERAAITNVTPNHLNWHRDMEEYIAAKANVFLHAPNRMLVTNAENEAAVVLARDYAGRVTYFSSGRTTHTDFEGLLKTGDRAIYCRDGQILLWDGVKECLMLDASHIALAGVHNLENYMTAIGLTDGLISPETLDAVAIGFTGVRHRLEYVCTVDGVAYYNSSIDSSPTRTAAALSALETAPIVIVGGRDKNFDFLPLAKTLCTRARAVVLTGETLPKVRAALSLHREETGESVPIYECPDFEGAVRLARSVAEEGDLVLLSPSATSFDAFRDFEERGDRFCEIVKGFLQNKGD